MTSSNLTARQLRTYDLIRDRLVKHGRAPSIREIAQTLEISSTSMVLSDLRRLVEAGLIARAYGEARGIEMPDAMVLFVGDEVLVEVDGQFVRGRVVEPVAKAA